MQIAYKKPAAAEAAFGAADALYLQLRTKLLGKESAVLDAASVERMVDVEGREILRELLQAHLTLRGRAVAVDPVVGSDGGERRHVRPGVTRQLETVFGRVRVERAAHSGRHLRAVEPVDADLNLPKFMYSHELERRLAREVARMSFDAAIDNLGIGTGASIPKRQAEEITVRSACDFFAFYDDPERIVAETLGSLLVLSFDQKGVVLVRQDLTEATRKVTPRRKLETRRSKGEKARGRKRMATVAAVYTVAPHLRTPADVIAALQRERTERGEPRPRPERKRVWATLERSPQHVIADAFDEAALRDPEHRKTWLVLIDGDPDLERWVRTEAKRRRVKVWIVLDFIHVLEYLWRASHALNKEGTPEAEAWVLERLARILDGGLSDVVAGMTRSATLRGLSAEQRAPIDKAARYLLKRKSLMRYGELLRLGAPIATGIIEGACRHLICDRLDITGARWTLDRADAVMRLRSLLASGDFADYWDFHEKAEHRRNHASRFLGGKCPRVAQPGRKPRLTLVQGGVGGVV